jgi:hypothetical protein
VSPDLGDEPVLMVGAGFESAVALKHLIHRLHAFHDAGVKHFHHPVVGELILSFNRLDLAADHGLTIFTYAAEPGSRSEEALNLLGSCAATLDLAEATRATDQS